MNQTLQPTLLVVDDERKCREKLRSALSASYRVLLASRGGEALETLAAARAGGRAVSVLLADQYMPGMTGATLLGRARAEFRETVRIMLVHDGRRHHPAEVLSAAGIYRIIAKNGDLADLLLTLHEACRTVEMEQKNAELARSLDAAIAGIAHELNTPLGIIRGSASLLSETLRGEAGATVERLRREIGPAFDDLLSAASLIGSHVGRVHQLVERMRWISQAQVSDTANTVDLGVLVAEIVRGFRARPDCAGLDVELIDSLGPKVDDRSWSGYPGCLAEVLSNLLVNASMHAYDRAGGDARRGGKIEVRLEVSRGSAGPVFAITVLDRGRGIAREELARVFDPFNGKCSGGARRGPGLGLPIVRNVVTSKLRGTVAIDSQPGRGTAVHIAFPRTTNPGMPIAA